MGPELSTSTDDEGRNCNSNGPQNHAGLGPVFSISPPVTASELLSSMSVGQTGTHSDLLVMVGWKSKPTRFNSLPLYGQVNVEMSK